MSYTALSDLHIIPQGHTGTAEYCIEEILNRSLMFSIRWKRKTGSVLTRKLCRTFPGTFSNKMEPLLTMRQGHRLVQRTSESILGERYLAWQLPRLEPNRKFVGYCASSVDCMDESTKLKVLEKHRKFACSQITFFVVCLKGLKHVLNIMVDI
ncbi:hypothetical protein LOD99_8489 [Oopsacas minuta]|uniref:Uncharacterized protein n=1 Tax=Oopsacas minuta TaxID=111878 RepID=A0AAV7JG15_9METZ|nr:hypothetical protein LOD99_8489 [Oopsacas minuta]